MVTITGNKVNVECECQEHILRISKMDFGEYAISVLTDNFSAKQDKKFFAKLKYKLKYIWYILIGREYVLDEIIITEKDYDEFMRAGKILQALNIDDYYKNLNNEVK